jgi:hypothetical protein
MRELYFLLYGESRQGLLPYQSAAAAERVTLRPHQFVFEWIADAAVCCVHCPREFVIQPATGGRPSNVQRRSFAALISCNLMSASRP